MFALKATALSILVAAATLVGAAGSHAGSASGTLISACGQVATGNAVLTTNLSCTGHGIVVGADGTTVDLQGHSINGDRGGSDHGVHADGYDHVTVKNGVLRNFGYGVAAYNGADYTSVVNVAATGNVVDGVFIIGQWPSVESTVASANNQRGIEIQGFGPKILTSTVTGNHLDGLKVTGSSTMVTSATVSGNDGHGIWIVGDNVKVKQSTATGNGGNGIFVQGDSAVIKYDEAPGNGFENGTADGDGRGILVNGFASDKPPTGAGNASRGNDEIFYACMPYTLC